MKLLFPIEFNESNVVEWKNTLSAVARMALNFNISRSDFLIIAFTVDEPYQQFLISRYDFLKEEKERNRRRNAARLAGKPWPVEDVKQPLNDIVKVRGYERLAIVPLEMVFNNMGKIIVVEGKEIAVRSKRYKCYARDGVKCIRCGIEGKYFAAERSKVPVGIVSTVKYHLNLYHVTDEGKEIMLTVDHVIPKSRGGEDNVKNLQPMCISCNNKKGNLTEEEYAAGLKKIDAQNLMEAEKVKRRRQALADLGKVRGKVISISPLTAGTECDSV